MHCHVILTQIDSPYNGISSKLYIVIPKSLNLCMECKKEESVS
jgi:serine protease inhibitor